MLFLTGCGAFIGLKSDVPHGLSTASLPFIPGVLHYKWKYNPHENQQLLDILTTGCNSKCTNLIFIYKKD